MAWNIAMGIAGGLWLFVVTAFLVLLAIGMILEGVQEWKSR